MVMASKALLVLGVLLATLLFVSATRELAEETKEKKANEAGVEDQKYGGYPGGGYHGGGGGYNGGGGGYHGGGGGYHGGGGGGGGYHGGGGGGYHGGGGYGHRCDYGCCHKGSYGGCHCCTHPDEIPDPEYLAEPQH